MTIITDRLRNSRLPALIHLLASVFIASICATLVFGIWYPYPFNQLAGGNDLFTLLIGVDVVIGPLLTLVVFDPNKPKAELWRDLVTIVLLQMSALIYGLYSTQLARPVFICFEGDRFRMVALPDIDTKDLIVDSRFKPQFFEGPKPLGVRLAKGTDPDFLESIKLSIDGLHPAFRPSRWLDYEQQKSTVMRKALPLSRLRTKHISQTSLINNYVSDSNQREEDLGYLPMIAGKNTEWSVLVSKVDGAIVGYLPLDGW